MSELIVSAYKGLWKAVGASLKWLDKAGDAATKTVIGAGAVLGILGFEAIYFSNAREVRLLFVILLAIPGGLVGALLAGLLGGLLRMFLAMVVIVSAVFLSVAPVVGAVYGAIRLLYAIVVWRN